MTKTQPRPPARRPLERRSLAETIRDSLQDRILDGEFREGEALIQENIAEEYGASRIPVREALLQLEACGLVSMEMHKGAVVTAIPTEEVQELFELRAMLECDLLERAIANITDQDILESRDILQQLGASYEKGELAAWGKLNWAFHKRLYQPARRPQTLALLQTIHLQTERYIRLHLLMTGGQAAADEDHKKILRLSAHREAQEACALLRDHIINTGVALVVSLRAHRADRDL